MARASKTSKSEKRFWTPGRVRVFCITIIVLVLLHMASVFIADTESRSMLKRGDFASFYAAAMMVRQGMTGQLYDPLLLQSVENLYWPSLDGRYVLFPYAPFYALALSPLAWFSPLLAKGIFTLFMILCLAGAFYFLEAQAPVLRKSFLAPAAFCFAFFPLTFSVFGGQNTALSFMLYSAVLYFFIKNDPKMDLIAGLFLGLWLFKPHFSLALAVLFCAAGFYRVALSAAGVGFVYFWISAAMAGRDWLYKWFEMLKQYEALELRFNAFNMISLNGFLECVSRVLPGGRTFAGFFHLLALLGSLVLAGFFLRAALRLRKKEKAYRRYELLRILRAAMPALLLASPHTVFYDSSLCLGALVPYLKFEKDREAFLLIGLTAAASAAVSFRPWLPVPPLFFGLAALLFYFIRKEKALLL